MYFSRGAFETVVILLLAGNIGRIEGMRAGVFFGVCRTAADEPERLINA
jgi:hypothetical protein